MSFHPDLQTAARFLPRGLGPAWLIKLIKRVPVPARALPEGVSVTERALDARPGVKVRIYGTPHEGRRPALLWIHGGGYVIGSATQDDPICGHFAKRLGITVISVDYRLAPEHPFPTPLDDCIAAYEWIHLHADALNIDPKRVAIAGQSAGGGLCAALAHAIFDRKWPAPRLQVLVYPMLDDRTVLRDATVNFRVWSPASNRLGWTWYLGREPGGADVPPLAAPARRESLAGLPPTWLGVGTQDLFHDEDLTYVERLRAAGVPVELEVVPGAFHGFDAVLPKAGVSQSFIESQAKALERALFDKAP